MADSLTVWQRIARNISVFFRRLSHCLGSCFNPQADDDQLLRDGPSQSPSVENNFISNVRMCLLHNIVSIIFFYNEQYFSKLPQPSPNIKFLVVMERVFSDSSKS